MLKILIFSFVCVILCAKAENEPSTDDLLHDLFTIKTQVKQLDDLIKDSLEATPNQKEPTPKTDSDKAIDASLHGSIDVNGDENNTPIQISEDINRKKRIERQVVNPRQGCGYRNTEGIGSRRPGAQEGDTNFGEITWTVGIHVVNVDPVTNSERSIQVCGGSLVNPKAVVTAAHCVLGRHAGKKIKVRAGEWDTQTTNQEYPYEERDVIEIDTPKNYRAGTLYNDIAILILNEPVTLGPHIGVLCLPQQKQTITNTDCFVSGWGTNKAGIQANVLRTVRQPIVDSSRCQEILRTTKLGDEFELHFNFICAGGVVGQDICERYGGSPLVCPIPGQQGRYYQAGLVSWGIGCGDHVPGVYTNVAEFRNWIDEQMQYKRLNESFYRF